jgi:2'-5' RNA ligase
LNSIITDTSSVNSLFGGLFLDEISRELLTQWSLLQNIANVINKEELHCTFCFSSTSFKFEHLLKNDECLNQDFRFNKFELFKTKEGKNALVLILSNGFQIRRLFNECKRAGANYTHEKYFPHVTISYDAGENFDISSLQLPDFSIQFNQIKFC